MFEHVLVPLDGSSIAECVLSHVVAIARPFGSLVTLLHILEPSEDPITSRPVSAIDWSIAHAKANAYLATIADRLTASGLRAATEVLEGRAAERIVEFAGSVGADLTVLSSHGRNGFRGWNISGVAQKVLLRLLRPILLVRASRSGTYELGTLRYQKLLIALDGSARAESILPVATVLAAHYRAQLLLAHVLRKPEIVSHAASDRGSRLTYQVMKCNHLVALGYLEGLKARLPGEAQIRLLADDNPAHALDDAAAREEADLIMANAHGRSGILWRPYGSTAMDLILYGSSPVLLLQDIPEEQRTWRVEEAPARDREL